MSTATSIEELAVDDRRATINDVWTLHNVVQKQIANRQYRPRDNPPARIPAADTTSSYRMLILSMLVTSNRYMITRIGCLEAIVSRDGSIDDACFARVWEDLTAVLNLVRDGEADLTAVLTRWANE